MRRRSKKLAFRTDCKAQIMRSARRSAALKSTQAIHAQGRQVLTSPPDDPRPPTHTQTQTLTPAPQPPSSARYPESFPCLLSRRPLWRPVNKDGTESERRTGALSHTWASLSQRSQIKNSVECCHHLFYYYYYYSNKWCI